MKKFISLLFGLQLGVLVALIYIKNYCTIYKGPDSNDIKSGVYEWRDKYIKFLPVLKIGPVGAEHN